MQLLNDHRSKTYALSIKLWRVSSFAVMDINTVEEIH